MKYYASSDLARFELATAITVANAALQAPEALKFMRKVTGLQGRQFADLLGVRPATVSRWESGKTPVDRATYSVLQQFLLDRLAGSSATERGLRVLMRPRKLQKRVDAEDVALAKILDRFGDRDGPRWMEDVEPYWIDRLVQLGSSRHSVDEHASAATTLRMRVANSPTGFSPGVTRHRSAAAGRERHGRLSAGQR